MIVQAMLQVFLNLIVFNMTPQQAIEAPRFAFFGFPNSFFPHGEVPPQVRVENPLTLEAAQGVSDAEIAAWARFEFDAGGVLFAGDILSPTPNGRTLGAGADPRRAGYAVGR
jgi:gamma-glutamyltranspeptidase/glutathione hydrolase